MKNQKKLTYSLLCAVLMLILIGCSESWPYKGVPDSAVVKVESFGYVILSDSVECDSVGRPQSEMWIWDKCQHVGRKWNGESVGRIDRARIISESPLIVITEEYYNPGYNCSIINTETGSVTGWSCDEGVLCVTPDEGLIIVGNKGFYESGGTYTILVIMDHNGNILNRIPLIERK